VPTIPFTAYDVFEYLSSGFVVEIFRLASGQIDERWASSTGPG
jgi:hypothetical protein